jgi:D-xylose transport system ATP-binding protein
MSTHGTDRAPALEVRGATKYFGHITALAGVDLTLGQGEILALLGDNGAGKSTLIKSISGVHALDSGEMYVDGEPVAFRDPGDARAAGIETVYQDLAVFDNLDVLANMYMGRELKGPKLLGALGRVKAGEMAERWREASAQLRITIPDPKQPIGLMSGGQRQAVAVARAATFAKRVVILDEPTAALGVRESGQVIELIQTLPAHGMSVILISHNMQHVLQIADRAVVLRQGRVVGEAPATKEHEHRLVSLIVGSL